MDTSCTAEDLADERVIKEINANNENAQNGRSCSDQEQRSSFYSNAKNYWETVSPTIDGMLGGFARISPTDINGSKAFLRPFVMGDKATTGRKRALDCGAGIGRITKRLLLTMFETVDMVEQNQIFLDQAEKFLGAERNRVERCICSGLQEFTPEEGRYDVIWCQWVLGHLTDSDLVDFFHRCRKGLSPNGIMCLKENVKDGSERDFDEQDSSWTRLREELEKLIEESGFRILKKQKQRGFPKPLYDVYMYALQ